MATHTQCDPLLHPSRIAAAAPSTRQLLLCCDGAGWPAAPYAARRSHPRGRRAWGAGRHPSPPPHRPSPRAITSPVHPMDNAGCARPVSFPVRACALPLPPPSCAAPSARARAHSRVPAKEGEGSEGCGEPHRDGADAKPASRASPTVFPFSADDGAVVGAVGAAAACYGCVARGSAWTRGRVGRVEAHVLGSACGRVRVGPAWTRARPSTPPKRHHTWTDCVAGLRSKLSLPLGEFSLVEPKSRTCSIWCKHFFHGEFFAPLHFWSEQRLKMDCLYISCPQLVWDFICLDRAYNANH